MIRREHTKTVVPAMTANNHALLNFATCLLPKQEQYRGIEEILKKSLKLLRFLARGNDTVQIRMFDRLDTLLRIKVVESDLAIALKEVCVHWKLRVLMMPPVTKLWRLSVFSDTM